MSIAPIGGRIVPKPATVGEYVGGFNPQPLAEIVGFDIMMVEAEATVGLSGNETTSALTAHIDETDDDPITAAALGTVEMLRTSLHDATGQKLEEERLYFAIPGSGEGTDGTNYDPTFYGYDDSGNQTRVKEPTGTIRRTVHDIHRGVTERWVGTN